MNQLKPLAILLFFGMTLLSYSQKSKTKDGKNSNTSSYSKGIFYSLSDSKINTELNEIGVTFFRNKYIITFNLNIVLEKMTK